MTDTFKDHTRGLTSPPEHAAVILPADADLATVTRAIYVGTAGNLKVRMAGGETVTLFNVPAGALLPIRVDQVLVTGTTAQNILGFW